MMNQWDCDMWVCGDQREIILLLLSYIIMSYVIKYDTQFNSFNVILWLSSVAIYSVVHIIRIRLPRISCYFKVV